MIGKRQHSSPIPENLACEISDATSQVRVSGNRRRGRLYNQPARHCPFFLSLSFSLMLTITHSFHLTLALRDRFSHFLFCKRILCKFTAAPDSTSRIIIPESPEGTVTTKWKAEKLFHVSTSRAFAEISRLERNLAGSTRFALGERKTEVPMKGQRHFLRSLRNYNAPEREYTNERISRNERAFLVAKIRIRALSHSQRERSQIYVILSLIHTHIRVHTRTYTYTRAFTPRENTRTHSCKTQDSAEFIHLRAKKKKKKKPKSKRFSPSRRDSFRSRRGSVARVFGSGSVQCQQRRSADDRES